MKTNYVDIKESIYKYQRSKNGLVARIYSNQINNSKSSKRGRPRYSLDTLRKWVFAQDNFELLYNNWVESGYKKEKTLSVDRINPLYGYTLSNLQLMTWRENLDKGRKEMTITQGRPVAQYNKMGELLGVYLSIIDAGKKTNVDYRFIGNCLRRGKNKIGKTKTAGGFIWKYHKLSKSQLIDIWNKANKK